MRNYSPNYIGLIKAAGVSDFVMKSLTGFLNKTFSDGDSTTNQGALNVTTQPAPTQPDSSQNYSYIPKPEPDVSNPALEAQAYNRWYSQQVQNYNKEQMHQNSQNSQIDDARRLASESKNIADRDKQVIDNQMNNNQPGF